MLFYLVGCGGGSGHDEVSPPTPAPWPIQVSITVSNYIHLDAYINGVKTDCVFDTGAPGTLYLPESKQVTAVVGNYERTLTTRSLWPEATFLDCIVGMGFFEGATEYFINLETSELSVR
jgi:hypothetical protein